MVRPRRNSPSYLSLEKYECEAARPDFGLTSSLPLLSRDILAYDDVLFWSDLRFPEVEQEKEM